MTGLLFCLQMSRDSTSDDRTAMLWSTDGQDEILAPVEHPHMILTQDNATSYSARASRPYLTTNNVQVVDWPPPFPDLNPIEHI